MCIYFAQKKAPVFNGLVFERNFSNVSYLIRGRRSGFSSALAPFLPLAMSGFRNGRNPPSRAGPQRRITGDDIFEEKHRISKKTAHPGLHSLVDAANPAASSRGSGRCSATTVMPETGASNG
jgi:hypothetical protein